MPWGAPGVRGPMQRRVLLVLAVAGCAERRAIVADPTPGRAAPAPSVSPKAPTPPRLVVHQRLGHPLRVDGCVGTHPCTEWVRYLAKPPRVMVEATPSPSGLHFFLWSRADGHARELDVFAVPTSGVAARTAHVVPGAGGRLVWVDGDRLFHHWGCGTGCAEVRLRDVRGRVLVEASGAWVEVDGTARAVVVEHGGHTVWMDFARGTGWESPPVPGHLFPTAVAWEQGSDKSGDKGGDGRAVRVTFGRATGGDVVEVCRPSPSPTKAALGAPLGTLLCGPP